MRSLTLIFLLFAALGAFAQKLPNKQEVSLWAPANIKIDGKANEWSEQFKAHNSAVNFSYTLSNDDENLYLLVRAVNPRIIEKILNVGVSLIINPGGKKDYKSPDNITVNYPQIEQWATIRSILTSAGDKANFSIYDTRKTQLTRTDFTVMMANKMFGNYSKTIKVKGIAAITDTLISAYNEVNIKAAANFGNDGAFTYELKVPLKYLGLSVEHPRFAYSLTLESLGDPGFNDYKNPITHQLMDADPDINSTTGFWSECTLAKAP